MLIASDLPLQGGDADVTRTMVDAIRCVLQDHGFRAGQHVVGYRSCDDSTAQSGDYERRRCAANANAFARPTRLVAVIGPFYSFCAQLMIPILNRARGGPLALVSPTTTWPSLTRGGAAALPPPSATAASPTSTTRRASATSCAWPAAATSRASRSRCLRNRSRLRSVYLLNDDEERRRAVHRRVRARGPAARHRGRRRAQRRHRAHEYAALAGRVARSGADGVVLGSRRCGGGDLVEALRERLGPSRDAHGGRRVLPSPTRCDALGRAAHGVYLATTEACCPPPGSLTPAARASSARFGARARTEHCVLEAAQAAEVVLQAIARSDGTRASVLRSLRSLHVTDGILGSFTFDRWRHLARAR